MIALPQDFVSRLTESLGAERAQHLCAALDSGEMPVSLRLNTAKLPTWPASLPDGEAVPWCETGRYLSSRPAFILDPLIHAGGYYVQEAASMFVAQAYHTIYTREGRHPDRVLDLCAAPGGKSTLWRSLMPEGSLLVANEPMRQRAQILAENLTKWGHPDTIVTNGFAEDFAPLTDYFDIVATDVPCSGEGMFRKDEGARQEWSVPNVIACAERQWSIVSTIWPALRPGGYLVYSTCTFNREENEDMVERIIRELGADLVCIPTQSGWHIDGDLTGQGREVYHFVPDKARGEGLFMAVLQKSADEVPTTRKARRSKGRQQPSLPPVKGGAAVAGWLKDDGAFKLFRPDATHIGAIRQSLFEDVVSVTTNVRALTAGILLAEEKGHKLIPQHALALSTALNTEAFTRQEISLEVAQQYLRREAICLPPEAPRGYVILTYEGLPLGFANNLGARANNMYPQEWRIRNK